MVGLAPGEREDGERRICRDCRRRCRRRRRARSGNPRALPKGSVTPSAAFALMRVTPISWFTLPPAVIAVRGSVAGAFGLPPAAVDHLGEGLLHVRDLLHFVVAPLEMKARHRDAPAVLLVRVEFEEALARSGSFRRARGGRRRCRNSGAPRLSACVPKRSPTCAELTLPMLGIVRPPPHAM